MWERSITRCVIFSVRQQYRFLFMSFTIARARARYKRGTGIKPGRPVEVKSRSNSRATINRDLFENDSDRSSVLSSCCERTVRMEYLRWRKDLRTIYLPRTNGKSIPIGIVFKRISRDAWNWLKQLIDARDFIQFRRSQTRNEFRVVHEKRWSNFNINKAVLTIRICAAFYNGKHFPTCINKR